MTEPITRPPGHLWSAWGYDRHKRRWYRHCGRGWACTAVDSVARGMKPKTTRGSK